MTEMEWVWYLIKERAEGYAERGLLVSLVNARVMVLKVCRENHVKRPARSALAYLAAELVRLTLEARGWTHDEDYIAPASRLAP